MDRLNQSLDLFTEGLRSDPEVRLDIRKELQLHLEEKVAEETAKGHSNEESVELALKTFGSSVEVADGLAAANRKRMKLRARIRLLAGTLLIPAVIICAFFSLDMASSFSILDLFFSESNNPLLVYTKKVFSFGFFRDYTPEQKLILYGDRSRKTPAEQQKAIWKEFPDNKIYAANYILTLISNNNDNDNDNDKDRGFILAEIEQAGRIDPDNALYNYLAAGVMLKDACNEVVLPRTDMKAKLQYRFELKDRALLEKAMREYLIGINKKYCSSHTVDFLKQKLQIMGDANSIPEQIRQIELVAGTMQPQLLQYRAIGKYMPEFAGILINEGKKQEALQYLNTWKQFIRQINSDGNFLMAVLITESIVSTDKEKLPPLYAKLGMAEAAKTAALEADLLSKPVREWKEKRQLAIDAPRPDRAGALASMLIPELGRKITMEELAPSRYAEYAFLQKVTLALINLILIAGMIIAIVATLYWRFRNGYRLLLLTPPPLTVLKILGCGVILPCVTYFALSQIEPLSGYDLGFRLNGSRLIAQIALLLLLIPSVILTLTRHYVTARCHELGVATPPPPGRIRKGLAATCLTLLVIAAFIPMHQFLTEVILFITGAVLIMLVIFQIGYWIANPFSVYYGAISRMRLLIFALTVVILTCAFRPVLDWRETEFIREDQIIFGSAENLTKIEGEVVKELRNKIDQAMTKILGE